MGRLLRGGEAWVLGFAVLVSYSTLAGVTGRELVAGSPVLDGAASWARLFQVAVCLAVALAATRDARPTRSPALHLLGAGACSASMPLYLLAGGANLAPSVETALLAAAPVLGNVGYVFLWLAWVELLARLDLRHIVVDYLLVHALSAALSFVLSWIDATVLAAVVALMPWAACGAYGKAARVVADAPYAHGEQEAHPWTFPVKPVVLMAVFATVNAFVRGMLPQSVIVYATAGVVAACLAALLAVCRRGVGSFDIWGLGTAAFMLSLAGLLGSHLSTQVGAIAASLATNAGFALFNVLLITALGNISYRFGVNSLILFGFAKAAERLAYLAGNGLVRLASNTDADGFALIVVALAMLLTAGFVTLGTGREEQPSWGVSFNPKAHAARTAAPTLGQRCAALSREAGLTRREEDVSNLLALDRTAAQIEQELCISNATVKTHTQAVYRKLGVHSRKELVGRLGTGSDPSAAPTPGA